jgi:hypothetical protein
MTVDQLRDLVDAFFSRSGGASLKLPSGWFGRPHDNFHELTSATVVDSTLIIVLDERWSCASTALSAPTLMAGCFAWMDSSVPTGSGASTARTLSTLSGLTEAPSSSLQIGSGISGN